LHKDANKIFVGDPVRLNQILINLISNAIKFTHVGSIHISVKTQKRIKACFHLLKFDITDTGNWNSAVISYKQFLKALAQADASVTRKYGGTGLRINHR
jgi:signal transduction histidine kinase